MSDWVTLGLFCAMLLFCIMQDISILYALLAGLLLFWFYGRSKGLAWKKLAALSFDGVKTVKNILIAFMLIGVLTAFWRAAGTIAMIVCYASTLIRPSVFLLMTFLLNCVVSVLTGTSFGTGATMGVICATMGLALNIDIRLIGGAVLSGAFFGDRCSPVSTSALLVSELTGTNIFDNIRRMLRSALIPFLLSCGVYVLLGLFTTPSHDLLDLRGIFAREFTLHWLTLLPAAVILLLSFCRVNVKAAMAFSIVCAIPVCLFLQDISPAELLRIALTGFTAGDAAVGSMMSGGGIVSMLKVTGIVCISSSYSGIFKETELLNGAKAAIEHIAKKATDFTSLTFTSALASMVACNQTLAVMLTHQLCGALNRDDSDFALDLEDSVIVIAPLVPWSIAGGVPLGAIGAPAASILFACYLYLLPLWRLALSFAGKRVLMRESQ